MSQPLRLCAVFILQYTYCLNVLLPFILDALIVGLHYPLQLLQMSALFGSTEEGVSSVIHHRVCEAVNDDRTILVVTPRRQLCARMCIIVSIYPFFWSF